MSVSRLWRQNKIQKELLGEKGRVLSWTKIFETPEEVKDEEYTVVMVKTKKGQKVVGRWVDYGEPELGDKVKSVLRKIDKADKVGPIEYLFCWKKE